MLAPRHELARPLDDDAEVPAPTPHPLPALLLPADGLGRGDGRKRGRHPPALLLDHLLLVPGVLQVLLPDFLGQPLRRVLRLPGHGSQAHRAVAVHSQVALFVFRRPAVGVVVDDVAAAVADGFLDVAVLVHARLRVRKKPEANCTEGQIN